MTSFDRTLRETPDARCPRIPAETRAEVKKLLTAGQTGAEIAAATGISLPSQYPGHPSVW